MGRYFGTDGIRGKANVYPMSPDFVLKVRPSNWPSFQRILS